ncbi:hypothetical protein D3C84_851560 [compost metagenome]
MNTGDAAFLLEGISRILIWKLVSLADTWKVISYALSIEHFQQNFNSVSFTSNSHCPALQLHEPNYKQCRARSDSIVQFEPTVIFYASAGCRCGTISHGSRDSGK